MIESDDLHLQIGKPVKVLLRSVDVLHNFYVPEFRGKMDMVPGSETYFTDSHEDGHLRHPLRRTVRRRSFADEGRGRGCRRGGLSGLARAADLRRPLQRPKNHEGDLIPAKN